MVHIQVKMSHSLSSYLCLADGDPHFVVEVPHSKLTVCFNINGEPGHILRLVTDHKHSGKQLKYTFSTAIVLYLQVFNYAFCYLSRFAFVSILGQFKGIVHSQKKENRCYLCTLKLFQTCQIVFIMLITKED